MNRNTEHKYNEKDETLIISFPSGRRLTIDCSLGDFDFKKHFVRNNLKK